MSVTVDSSPEEKAAYIQGYRDGIRQAAVLAPIYEGQSELSRRIESAGFGAADLYAQTLGVPTNEKESRP